MTKKPAPPTTRPTFGKTVPAGEATELTGESAWVQFEDLAARQDASFAATQRADSTQRGSTTIPGALLQRKLKAVVPPSRATLDDAMVEARRHNRVCPKPLYWYQLYDLLPAKTETEPAPPLDGRDWQTSSALNKRMVFRDHLEWAANHGALAEAMRFMAGLREDEWLHMDDIA